MHDFTMCSWLEATNRSTQAEEVEIIGNNPMEVVGQLTSHVGFCLAQLGRG